MFLYFLRFRLGLPLACPAAGRSTNAVLDNVPSDALALHVGHESWSDSTKKKKTLLKKRSGGRKKKSVPAEYRHSSAPESRSRRRRRSSLPEISRAAGRRCRRSEGLRIMYLPSDRAPAAASPHPQPSTSAAAPLAGSSSRKPAASTQIVLNYRYVAS